MHRLGQIRPVHVTRYLVPNSIEDRMVAMQMRKMKLVSLTFNEDSSSSSSGGNGSASSKGKRKAGGGDRQAQNEARLQNMRMMLLGPSEPLEVIEVE